MRREWKDELGATGGSVRGKGLLYREARGGYSTSKGLRNDDRLPSLDLEEGLESSLFVLDLGFVSDVLRASSDEASLGAGLEQTKKKERQSVGEQEKKRERESHTPWRKSCAGSSLQRCNSRHSRRKPCCENRRG